jgi:tyrosyl-tRNA synthetase
MSIPDTLLAEWIRLALPDADPLSSELARTAATEPYETKRALAHRIAALYHGEEAAGHAEAQFDRVFRDHATPDDVEARTIELLDPRLRTEERGGVWLPGLLVASGLAPSNAEASRLIEQGAIAIDEHRITDRNAVLPAQPGHSVLIRRGKRNFVRITLR